MAASLNKPVKQSDLLKAIQKVLSRASLATVGSGEPQSHQEHEGTETGQDPRSLHILLAEDNPVNQRLAVKFLEIAGHSVATATNGREVLAHLEHHTPALILMDIQMPEMDGLEATVAIRLREQKTGHRIPIIALTAHAIKGDREKFLSAGMDAYITKPLKKE